MTASGFKRLLKGGRVVDPANGRDGVFDVLIEGDRVRRVGRDLPVDADVSVVEIPGGFVVVPGLIDMHVHLREPGQEHKETVATGTAAAVAGGFTAVACMPNTSPVNDNAGVTEYILKKAAEAGLARVYPIGAVSRGQKGEQLADIAELKQAGCVAITDDGHPVATALLMRRALEYAGMFDLPVIEHCEEQTLKGDGVAHEGAQASALGLRGIPGEAESIMALRDIALAELTGGSMHVAHMSARQTLDAVRWGKSRGARVSCEVTPHHFVLTDAMLREPIAYDTNVKMNPPLREAADRNAMLAGLADGSVDVIATDHAPHHYDEKRVEFDRAPFGITGLETAVSLCFDRLVHAGVLSMSRLVELMSTNPARILRVAGGSLSEGAPADVSILAPDLSVTVAAAAMRS
ncbi:MAG TPA: dihydroorotase, partial [Vicinamibacterales bacterium]